MSERDVFIEALQIDSPADRLEFLNRACGVDLDLRRHVDALLDSHARAGRFLEEPALIQVVATAEGSACPDLVEFAAETVREGTRTEPLSLSFLSPPQAEDELGRLGHCRLLRLLGEGGMGIVFLAEDTRLQRPVAVKVMRPELAADSEGRERFLREGRAAALIRSDHVVTIHHVDQAGSLPFLVMDLLRGELLAEKLDRVGRLPLSECLRIGREIAEGLMAAHATGLIHRDIKPANVWLEEPIGRVKLLDFGLARARTGPRITQRHVILGTPAYMAPEQAAGRPQDERSDLFSLGAVLYHMLTGRRPFAGDDLMTVLSNIATTSIPPAASLVPNLPPTVTDLLDRLLSRDPGGRSGTAAEVVNALKLLEASCAGAASPYELLAGSEPADAAHCHRTRRWVLMTGILGGLAGLAVVVHGIPIGKEVGTVTDTPKLPPVVPTRGPAPPSVSGTTNPAGESRTKPTYEDKADPPPREFTLTGQMPQVEAVTFTADGKTMIAASYWGEVIFWDLARRKKTFEMNATTPANLRCVAVDPQNRWLAVGQNNPDIRLFRFGEPLAIGLLPGVLGPRKHEVMQVVFLRDGRTLLSTGYDGYVRSWDVESKQEGKPYLFPGKKNVRIDRLALWEDGKGVVRLAIAGPNFVRLDGDLLEQLPYQPLGLAMSRDGTRLACPAKEHGVALWRLPDRTRLGVLPVEENPQALAFTPDGKYTVVTVFSRTFIYETDGGKLVACLSHSEKGISMAVSPDGRWLAVGTMTGAVRVWHLPQVLEDAEKRGLGNKKNDSQIKALKK